MYLFARQECRHRERTCEHKNETGERWKSLGTVPGFPEQSCLSQCGILGQGWEAWTVIIQLLEAQYGPTWVKNSQEIQSWGHPHKMVRFTSRAQPGSHRRNQREKNPLCFQHREGKGTTFKHAKHSVLNKAHSLKKQLNQGLTCGGMTRASLIWGRETPTSSPLQSSRPT